MNWLELIREQNLVSNSITDTEIIAAKCPADFVQYAPDCTDKNCDNDCSSCWRSEFTF